MHTTIEWNCNYIIGTNGHINPIYYYSLKIISITNIPNIISNIDGYTQQ